MIYILGILLIASASFAAFHFGAVYGTRVTAHKWTDYIMDECIRKGMLLDRLSSEFEKAEKIAPPGAPIVMAQDTLLRIIAETIELQNRGRDKK